MCIWCSLATKLMRGIAVLRPFLPCRLCLVLRSDSKTVKAGAHLPVGLGVLHLISRDRDLLLSLMDSLLPVSCIPPAPLRTHFKG
jgi:hypothetical protein